MRTTTHVPMVALLIALGSDAASAQTPSIPEISYGDSVSGDLRAAPRDEAGIPYRTYLFQGERGHRVNAKVVAQGFRPLVTVHALHVPDALAAGQGVDSAAAVTTLRYDDFYMITVTSLSATTTGTYQLSLEAESGLLDVDLVENRYWPENDNGRCAAIHDPQGLAVRAAEPGVLCDYYTDPMPGGRFVARVEGKVVSAGGRASLSLVVGRDTAGAATTQGILFRVSPDLGIASAYQRSNGQWLPLFSRPSTAIKGRTEWNVMAIEVRGTTVYFALNGRVITSHKLSAPIGRHAVALANELSQGASLSTVIYRDLMIEEL